MGTFFYEIKNCSNSVILLRVLPWGIHCLKCSKISSNYLTEKSDSSSASSCTTKYPFLTKLSRVHLKCTSSRVLSSFFKLLSSSFFNIPLLSRFGILIVL